MFSVFRKVEISSPPPTGAVEDSWDPQSVSPWWQQVRSACIQSQNTAAALLAAFVAHHAAKSCIKHRADSKVNEQVSHRRRFQPAL